MWNQGLVLALLMVYTAAYDRDVYKNCSQVDLCSQNRNLARQNRYKVVIEGSTYAQGVANIQVQNTAGTENYNLVISVIEGDVFRVQFSEPDSNRYQLEYMLDEEPTVVNFDNVDLSFSAITIVAGDNKAVVNVSPLSVEFYAGNLLQLVLEGDRLTLQTLENSTPFTFGVKYPSALRVYGLHEHADHLALRTTEVDGYDPYRVRTMDLTYYELYDTQAMYGAVPVLYGHGLDSTSGVFLHNAAEEWVEITNDDDNGPGAFFMVDSGSLDLFVLLGPTPADATRQYVSLTGLPHLPPMWSLGYHQCRWGYWNETDLQTVIAELDAHDFPIDAIWLDIQHTDDDKFFTWNPENFSTPLEMLANLSSTNRHLVTLTDPHFKKEEGYFVYDEIIAQNYAILNPNETVYEAECWPGTSVWMDYLNPDVRDYYSSLYSYDSWEGTDSTLSGIWNDMNEAALFDNDTEKTFPYDLVHYGGVQNRNIHNIYGLLQIMSTHAGLIARDEGTKRPFILTRAHTAGTQRYSAIWTGDNTAEWGFINISYSMCLSAALTGISFCGADIGGFWGEPTEELIQRFFQSGAWLPFFREHSGQDSARREPYLWSEEVQNNLRRTIRRRYEHLPYWYTVFYEHIRNGDPVIRPLWYEYPDNADVVDIDDQLFVGSNVIVKAIDQPGVTSVPMYLPGDADLEWFVVDLDSDDTYPGGGWIDIPVTIDQIPVFYKEGSIIPVKVMERASSAEMKDDWYMLYILLDDYDFSASGNLYIDDEISFEYRESDNYNYVKIDANWDNYDVTLTPIDESNSEDFDVVLGVLVFMVPEVVKSPHREIKRVRREFDRTADGTLLKDLKLSSKKPTTIKLPIK